ncbi:transmembrane protein, putative (macronuclear) [Tetrahymena thermophila SB210]|uniref:Transmembrane protein, putative n=1 Tax=Tetrahymena thermophila (strain SB210) TaxID=312017 RepID=Q22MF0_TETTS|nr:transmembrane protein, putative [Tetrahymena thermophila SB210]EAR86595.2 transmembrane protein, putative [Tetrahymena thermophila SB210]|eukprot:XP_977070.2 transmembrane protein, putative [Tetrahymena thermophila SB210]
MIIKGKIILILALLNICLTAPINIPLNSNNWQLVWGGNQFQYATIANGQKMSWVGQHVSQCCSCGEDYDTYSTLVESTNIWARYFKLNITASTPAQARQGSAPCAWEVFWVGFNWRWTTQPEKNSNYIIYKPAETDIDGGLELGTMSQTVGQTFLYTPDPLPKYGALQIGKYYTYNINRGFNSIQLGLNNTYYPSQPNTGLFDQLGSIMLYTEDSSASISSVSIDFYQTTTRYYSNTTIQNLANNYVSLESTVASQVGVSANKIILTGLQQLNSTTIIGYFYQNS